MSVSVSNFLRDWPCTTMHELKKKKAGIKSTHKMMVLNTVQDKIFHWVFFLFEEYMNIILQFYNPIPIYVAIILNLQKYV